MSRTAYDVLVLDINLGGKQTGADVLRIARTLPGYGAVTALAVTAYALPGDREEFLRAGFDGYVSKPFTVSALLAALRAAGVPLKA
jgi:CheY-like chemotaxis protein